MLSCQKGIHSWKLYLTCFYKLYFNYIAFNMFYTFDFCLSLMQSVFIKSFKISRWCGVLVCSGYHNNRDFFFFYCFLSLLSAIWPRDQIVNIHWIIEKARGLQKDIYFCFIDYSKAFDHVDHNKLWIILTEMGIPDHLTCLLRNLYGGQEATGGTVGKLGKEYVKAVYYHPVYLTYM